VYNEAQSMFQKLVRSNSENAAYKDGLLVVETKMAEAEKALKTAGTGSSSTPTKPDGPARR
jgi:hypothetical protein